MRKIILAAAVLAIWGDAAFAADILNQQARSYAPMQIRATYNWTGLYAGANFGGGWASANSEFSFGGTQFATAKNSPTGVLGGLQLGYNWQSGSIVYGVETDFQFTSQKGSIDAPSCPAGVCGVATSASYSQKMPWFGTLRGRIGYAQDSWLIYGTAGYAYARLNTDATATAGATTVGLSQNANRSGWAIGGGVELALDRRWTAKLEYLYMDFGKRDVTWAFAGLPTITDHIRFNENLVRAGINYRF